MNYRIKNTSPVSSEMAKTYNSDPIVVPNGKKLIEKAKSNMFISLLGAVGGLIYALKRRKNPYIYTGGGFVLAKIIIYIKDRKK